MTDTPIGRTKPVAAGRTRTLYVANYDLDVWLAAIEKCKNQNVSLSSVVADLLRNWVGM